MFVLAGRDAQRNLMSRHNLPTAAIGDKYSFFSVTHLFSDGRHEISFCIANQPYQLFIAVRRL